MARKQARPKASRQVTLQLHQIICREGGSQMRMGHHSHRTVTTLQGVTRLTLKVYRVAAGASRIVSVLSTNGEPHQFNIARTFSSCYRNRCTTS